MRKRDVGESVCEMVVLSFHMPELDRETKGGIDVFDEIVKFLDELGIEDRLAFAVNITIRSPLVNVGSHGIDEPS